MTISQKMTNKRRENISIAMKGKHNSPKTEFKKGHHPVAGFQKGHKLNVGTLHPMFGKGYKITGEKIGFGQIL